MEEKNKWVELLLCIFGGFFGLHCFYVGNIVKGILYLCTLGLCGIGWLVDIIRIIVQIFQDNKDNIIKAKDNLEQNIAEKNKEKEEALLKKKKQAEEKAAKIIMQLKGMDGKMYLYEDKIVISRRTFGGVAAFGAVGDRTIYYNFIQGIEYGGSILRILPIGGSANAYNAMSFADIASRDSYTLLISPFRRKEANRVYEFIDEKLKSINRIKLEEKNSNISNADEILKFKKMLDEGIITQEEYEKKKQELLK